MTQSTINLSSSLECPKCGKSSIVSHQTGIYQCLSCDFERDLSTEPVAKANMGFGEFLFACAGVLVTLALLL